MLMFSRLRSIGRVMSMLGGASLLAAPAAALPSAAVAPALEFGGFEIAQNLWACSVITDNALTDASLRIDEGRSTEGPIQPGMLPAKVAGNTSVTVGVICLPTNNPKVTRVMVAAGSSNAMTAAMVRNALRADIAGRAKGGSGSRFTVPVSGAAPTLDIAYPHWTGTALGGRRLVDHTPSRAADALRSVGLTPLAPTPGGEVAGGNANVSVVVAANLCTPGCFLLGSAYAVIASSSAPSTSAAYRDRVQRAFDR